MEGGKKKLEKMYLSFFFKHHLIGKMRPKNKTPNKVILEFIYCRGDQY